MARNNIEIEIQVNVENPKPLMKFLEKNGDFQSEKTQIDEYFSPTHESFLKVRPVSKWLRLRNANGEYSLTYKNWYYDKNGKSHYCDELETKIKDIDQARKILFALNFRPIVVVNKLRKTWVYQDYEIAIDSVKNLGDFVEIEYLGIMEKTTPKKITEKMISFLKEIDCGRITRNYLGYPFLILFPKENRYETQ